MGPPCCLKSGRYCCNPALKGFFEKVEILAKCFYVWLRRKSWCIDKSKMQQSEMETDLASNHDIQEACNLNAHLSSRSRENEGCEAECVVW